MSVINGLLQKGDAGANARKLNQQIEKQIATQARERKEVYKILLLGASDSGKSTITKQMKILNQSGFSKQELVDVRPVIHRNLYDSALLLVSLVRQQGIKLDPLNSRNCSIVTSAPAASLTVHLSPEFGKAVYDLWNITAIKSLIYKFASNFLDSAPYFFQRASEICQPDYVPSVSDVLHSRSTTQGISEMRFNLDNLKIHMFDVGGQRSERRKWIFCFENVHTIIFCVSLNDYDKKMSEGNARNQNKLMESVALFDSILNSPWFSNSSIILFLNKFDLFRQKLDHVPFNEHFPDYNGKNNVKQVIRYILWLFINPNVNRMRHNIYPHVTTAVDTSNIRVVFNAVKETILQHSLKQVGIC
ncbi:heterotrimeric G protein alpha-2 subunit Gpa2 [Schizosaccharomyces japonicus yFS275]|uniref:Heterotrimeric G protein alpha-2 subunit Gpa2 n=1 Tax=Schizosaccharomyces japonicus (strain yFS275 / FY16936) TaxID=402676 RepID=B6K2H6_SCHJY|nr:heterotrimeric G protein alpha-2 subunit Gpa2 [Schizosaccharomyces japonicus yFS275]EEB07357.1 heterotrimeric G protein alpha-2 subunit Gpa2 [Schizosaccharomyces japonicus yFS275]